MIVFLGCNITFAFTCTPTLTLIFTFTCIFTFTFPLAVTFTFALILTPALHVHLHLHLHLHLHFHSHIHLHLHLHAHSHLHLHLRARTVIFKSESSITWCSPRHKWLAARRSVVERKSRRVGGWVRFSADQRSIFSAVSGGLKHSERMQNNSQHGLGRE